MADEGALGQIAEERPGDDDRPNSGSPDHFPGMAAGGSTEDNINDWLDPYPDMSVDRLEAMLETQRYFSLL